MIATVFDTETSGLIENHVIRLERQPYVVEFYGCHVDLESGELLDELDLLIRPPAKDLLTDDIVRITGITWEMLADKPEFKEVEGRITPFLVKNGVIIAHNLSFDMEVIDIELERLGKKIQWPRRKVCSVEQTLHLKGRRLNLTDLHQHLFGVPFSGAHRARTDVMALVRCCSEMLKLDMI